MLLIYIIYILHMHIFFGTSTNMFLELVAKLFVIPLGLIIFLNVSKSIFYFLEKAQ